MSGLKAVVAHSAGCRKPDVDERGPSLQLVVLVAMKEIGSADRDTCRCGFNGCKSGVVVHNIVGKENFLSAATAHV